MRRAAASATRWWRRSIWRRPSSTISAARRASHILEGRSLMPLLRGEQPADWRKVIFSEYDYSMQDVRLKLNQPIEQCRLFMVYDGRWKYIHASGFRPMLYDLAERSAGIRRPRRGPFVRRCHRATASGAVRLGAASEDAHHDAERKDRDLCRQADAGQRRHFDRHLGRGGTGSDPRSGSKRR